jgi:hypothetical protein
MKNIKKILKNLWSLIVKYLLSKTTLDEKVAAKVKELDSLDEEKPTEEKIKK